MWKHTLYIFMTFYLFLIFIVKRINYKSVRRNGYKVNELACNHTFILEI